MDDEDAESNVNKNPAATLEASYSQRTRKTLQILEQNVVNFDLIVCSLFPRVVKLTFYRSCYSRKSAHPSHASTINTKAPSSSFYLRSIPSAACLRCSMVIQSLALRPSKFISFIQWCHPRIKLASFTFHPSTSARLSFLQT